MHTLDMIKKYKICAIVRGVEEDKLDALARSLIKGGIHVIEVTYNTPGASNMIAYLSKNYKNEFIIGAGTVLDSETAKSAIDAGAKFILSPTIDEKVIQMCNKYGILAVPGVMTPTEALKAWEYGAQIIKVFPANVLTPAYIKQIRGPLNQLEIMVVGGVGLNNIKEFFDAGACSAGIGSDLVNKDIVNAGDFTSIEIKAKEFIEQVS